MSLKNDDFPAIAELKKVILANAYPMRFIFRLQLCGEFGNESSQRSRQDEKVILGYIS